MKNNIQRMLTHSVYVMPNKKLSMLDLCTCSVDTRIFIASSRKNKSCRRHAICIYFYF